ncbi:MAG: WecB/TagA/CpsF family glycosyltransferase [Candidatus Doudnabacteria bacterium]|nr:WecB/TagA/CpsF family glycosyltransferase [Candidatus Doudnabacteria bacterium]
MKIDIAGVLIDNITKEEALENILQICRLSEPGHIVTTYSELIVFAEKDEKYRKILNSAALSLPDGIGILWAAYYLSSVNHHLLTSLAGIILNPFKIRSVIKEQVTGRQLIWDIAKLASEKNYSLALVGGKDGVAQKTAERLKVNSQKLKVNLVLSECAFDEQLVQKINQSNSDILLIAYQPPKQEIWLAQNLKNLNVKVALGLGGTFDYIAKKRFQSPKILHFMGLEWLWRLLTQPWRIKRIWNAVPVFIWRVNRYKSYKVKKV